jgi:hypothetical protein
MPKRTIKETYSPATYALYEFRISAEQVARARVPSKSRIGISFELMGRNALTEETLDAIRGLSAGNQALAEDVKRLARTSFIERNPRRPERHAFVPRKVTP